MKRTINWKSLPSLVLGIIFGILFNPITVYVSNTALKESWHPTVYIATVWIFMALPASITGIVLAALGMGEVKAESRKDGKTITGLILNILALVSLVLLLCYLLGSMD